jgi:hypothetical protein
MMGFLAVEMSLMITSSPAVTLRNSALFLRLPKHVAKYNERIIS